MAPSVFLTRELLPPVMDFLKRETVLTYNAEDRALTKEEIINGAQGKEALISLVTDVIDREVIEQNPQLRVISNYGVGFNNIDVEAATKHGIVVTNTPGVLTETTADLAWALLMACARRVVEADAFTRRGEWKAWAPSLFLGRDVYGTTLGIAGMGRIGKAVARRANGFNMRVLYYSRTKLPEREERELNATDVDKETLLKEADFVSLHMPYQKDTHHFIDEAAFTAMKPTSYLINTSRGPTVDEQALVQALKKGEIAGAGLDVYEEEPRITPELLDMDNVVCLPHIGSASVKTRTAMGMLAAKNALDVLAGRPCAHVVNKEVLNQ